VSLEKLLRKKKGKGKGIPRGRLTAPWVAFWQRGKRGKKREKNIPLIGLTKGRGGKREKRSKIVNLGGGKKGKGKKKKEKETVSLTPVLGGGGKEGGGRRREGGGG